MPTVTIKTGESLFWLNGDSEAHDVLYDALSYENPEAQFIPAYQNGNWDGIHRLYSNKKNSAPVGLADRAKDALERNGYDVEFEEARSTSQEDIETSWNFDHDLREYQLRAIENVAKQKGGIVALPTGAGKTVVALRIIHNMGKKSIIFVHTKELLYQWEDRVRDILGVEPGIIGDGNWSEGPVTVAMMQTVDERGSDGLGDYYASIFDECHRTSAAETFHDVGIAVRSWFRVGLSATPWRRVEGEQLKIEGAIGGKAFEIGAEELIREGYLSEPQWRVIDPTDWGKPTTGSDRQDYQDVYQQCVVEDKIRNRSVAATASELARDGYSTLVSVDRIDHGDKLQGIIDGSEGVECRFIYGDHSSDERNEVLGQFERGEIDVLISTLVREGVDIPSINAVVIAEAGKSDIAKIQTIGRALRPENGDHAVIVDVEDSGPFLREHYNQRIAAYCDYYGEFGPKGDSNEQKVRAWLRKNGIDTGELCIREKNDGTVEWEVDGYIENFDWYMDKMKDTDAIRYQGDHVNAVYNPGELE